MPKLKDSPIHLATDLESYFQEQVSEVARKQGLSMSSFAQNYLVSLLDRYSKTSHYLMNSGVDTGDGEGASAPSLALIWLEGLSKTLGEQYIQMQSLGDFALFTRGFFGDHVRASLVDLDYYSAIGENAYARAGQIRESLMVERDLNTFFELSEGFNRFAEVLAELSDQNLLNRDKDILKLYQKWHATRSHRIFRMLAEKGIIAGANDPTGPQSEGSD